ncbi:MAG: phospholipase [Bacteroidales bacterium]|nr:phospholipase [Bacteroidales bacterium]
MIKGLYTSLTKPVISLFLNVVSWISRKSFPGSYGNYLKASLIHDRLERTFIIYVASSYDRSVKMPLVIALHGRGVDGEGMIIVTRKGFDRLAERDAFLVVYPDGIELNWNDGRRDQEDDERANSENIDDVGFIAALTDMMVRDYNADPRRVYVTGISNGAIMSYRLACELSHRIAAIAPVDGSIPLHFIDDCSPSRHVPVLAMNNVDDPVVPFEGGEIYGHFGREMLGKVLSVDQSVGYWVKKNGCSQVPVITEEPDRDPTDGTRVTRKEYVNEVDGTEVILYVVHGGGHTWPGGLQYLPSRVIGKTSRDIDASDVIWSFFKKQNL